MLLWLQICGTHGDSICGFLWKIIERHRLDGLGWGRILCQLPIPGLEIKLSNAPCENVRHGGYTNAPFLGHHPLRSQDVSIYKQNFEQKPSFNFNSLNMKDIIIAPMTAFCRYLALGRLQLEQIDLSVTGIRVLVPILPSQASQVFVMFYTKKPHQF